MPPLIKSFWQPWISFNARLGFWLILLFGLLRFVAVLYGIQSGNNAYLSLIFLLMILLPFLLLRREGRRAIGFVRPKSWPWLLFSIGLGMAAAGLIYLLGVGLYSTTTSNWFVYIGESYPLDLATLPAEEKALYFWIFAGIGMSFSPFGEEILYRGPVLEALAQDLGQVRAGLLDSAAFGLTHLAHFGLVYQNPGWKFLAFPALLWVILMFLSGLLFNFCKQQTQSIWGAILCHIGFNLSMTYWIFFYLF